MMLFGTTNITVWMIVMMEIQKHPHAFVVMTFESKNAILEIAFWARPI